MTSEDANRLYELIKFIREKHIMFPDINQKGEYHVDSLTSKDSFIFNVARGGRIKPNKCTYQIRTSDNSILFRIDLDGPAHPNPNGVDIQCPHLHVYKYDDDNYFENWAYPLLDKLPTNPEDLVQVFLDFLVFNKVQNSPIIETRMEF